MKKLITVLFVFFALAHFAQSTGDTILIKAFKYGSTTKDTAIQFPNNSTSYEKIIMKYNMRCKNGLVSTSSQRNLGCGEWDYSCNTFIADSSRIESEALSHPDYIISNFSGSTFYYTTFPLYDYYLYAQTNVLVNSIISETQYTVGTGNTPLSDLLKTNEKSGKTQLLYTAAELTSAGITAGNIDAILLNVINTGGSAGFFNLGIQHSTVTALSSSSLILSGFTNVYNANYTFVNGNNRIQFHTPFSWNGTDNLLLEYSFTNNVPSSPVVLNGMLTPSVSALFANNNYALDLSNNGHVTINSSSLTSISNEITVSFWAFGNSSLMPANTSLLYAYANNPNERTLNLHLPWSDNSVYFDCGFSNGGFDRISKVSNASQQGGQWNHWAFTKNTANGLMRIYLNGVFWAAGNVKTKPITILNMILGKDAAMDNNYKGKVNELSIWNKELSIADVKAIMTRSITPSHPFYANLLAYYRMNEGTGSIINDVKNMLTSGGSSVYWTFDRGNKLNRMFTEVASKPTIVFLRGSYSLTTNTVSVKDSIARNPTIVQQYSITSNATVTPMANDVVSLVSTNSNWYNASPISIYNGDTGVLTGTFAVSPQGSITINNLNYYHRHPYYIELMSFVTPYGIGLDLGMNGKSWYFDVTDYAPLLKGNKRFLMTMGGQNQEQIDIDFLFVVGTPPRNVLDCYQLWQGAARMGGSSISCINNDICFNTQTITTNSLAKSFKMRSTITGHGSEGEFGQNGGNINHYFNINGGANEFSWQITRPCSGNPIFPQGGTWLYERQGWCPGEYSLLKEYDITPYVTPGSTVTLDYNCANPQVSTGDYRYLAAHQLISYGAPNHNLDVAIVDVRKPGNNVIYSRENPMCAQPVIIAKNTGSTTISSIDIDYWINSSVTKQSYHWNGTLAFSDTVSITLPIGTLWQNGLIASSNRFYAELKKANGSTDNYSYNNKMSALFSLPDVITDSLTIEIQTNNNPFENSYKIVDDANNVIAGASSLTAPYTVYSDSYILNGCYKLIMEDTGEDGLSWWANASQGTGYIKLKNAQGNVIKTFEPDFGRGFEYSFSTKPYAYVSVSEMDWSRQISIHPNPAHGKFQVNLKNSENTVIVITDMLGRTAEIPFTIAGNSYIFDSSGLKEGMYFVKITQENKTETRKIIIY